MKKAALTVVGALGLALMAVECSVVASGGTTNVVGGLGMMLVATSLLGLWRLRRSR